MRKDAKIQAVQMFLRGHNVTDVAAFHAVKRGEVEQVLREAIQGLSHLKAPESRVQTVEPSEVAIAHG